MHYKVNFTILVILNFEKEWQNKIKLIVIKKNTKSC